MNEHGPKHDGPDATPRAARASRKQKTPHDAFKEQLQVEVAAMVSGMLAAKALPPEMWAALESGQVSAVLNQGVEKLLAPASTAHARIGQKLPQADVMQARIDDPAFLDSVIAAAMPEASSTMQLFLRETFAEMTQHLLHINAQAFESSVVARH